MAQFSPQTGQLIQAAAQGIIQQGQQQREMQLREEQLENERKREQRAVAAQERELTAREGFLQVQQKQLELSTANADLQRQIEEAKLEGTRAETDLTRARTLGVLATEGPAAAKPLTIPNREAILGSARQFDLDLALNNANVTIQNQQTNLSDLAGLSRDEMERQVRGNESEINKLVGTFVAPQQRSELDAQVSQIRLRTDRLREGIRVANETALALPSDEAISFASQSLGISGDQFRVLQSADQDIVSLQTKLLPRIPQPLVNSALRQAQVGNLDSIISLAEKQILTGNPGAPLNKENLKAFKNYLRLSGVTEDTLQEVVNHFLGVVTNPVRR